MTEVIRGPFAEANTQMGRRMQAFRDPKKFWDGDTVGDGAVPGPKNPSPMGRGRPHLHPAPHILAPCGASIETILAPSALDLAP